MALIQNYGKGLIPAYEAAGESQCIDDVRCRLIVKARGRYELIA